MSANGAEGPNSPLGDDILYVGMFDDDWMKVLGAVVTAREVETIAAFLDANSGTSIAPSNRLSMSLYELFMQQPEAARGPGASALDRLQRHPRHVMAAVASMDADLGHLLFRSIHASPSLRATDLLHSMYLNRKRADEQLSINDLLRLGTRFGWEEADLVEALSPACFTNWVRGRPGFDAFVEKHSERVAEIYERFDVETMRRPASFLFVPDALLGLLARQIADKATDPKKQVRLRYTQFQERVNEEAIVPALKELVLSGNATKRRHVAALLVARTSPANRADLNDWFAANLADETSPAIRAVVQRASKLPGPRALEPIELSPARVPADVYGTVHEPIEVQRDDDGSSYVELHGSSWLLMALPRVDAYVDVTQIASAFFRLGTESARSFLNMSDPVGYLTDKGLTPTVFAQVAQAKGKPLTDAVVISAELSDLMQWSAETLSQFVHLLSGEFVAVLNSGNDYSRPSLQAVFALLHRAHRFFALPRTLVESLAQIAMTGSQTLKNETSRWDPSTFAPFAVAQLADASPTRRRTAAMWLGAHHHRPALDPLLAAVEVETSTPTRLAMLAALQGLGHPALELVDRDAVVAHAFDEMKKKSSRSSSISWLDARKLPALTWHDGEAVEPAVVELLLHTSAKANDPAATASALALLSAMRRKDVDAFGLSLFRLWRTQDLTPRKGASAETTGWGRTSVGILGIAAASGDSDLVSEAIAYLKSHRDGRPIQAKAVIDMLAWIDDPAAAQSVIAMATRYRPKALQTHASRATAQLAARSGWTHEELADRSAPDGGFDESGRRRFDFGLRSFTATINDDLSISIVDAESGKTARSLPLGRKDEDPAVVKEARADFTMAKRDMAAAADHQPFRLRRSMAIQRSWTEPDFRTFILDHPLMVRLATRLIWVAEDTKQEVLFRPLADGTLLGVDSQQLTLGEAARIRIAHTRTIDDVNESASVAHLAEHAVRPLFAQFGRKPAPGAPIRTFAGRVVRATSFAKNARRLGWQVSDTFGTGSSIGVTTAFNELGIAAVLTVRDGLYLGGYDASGDETCTVDELIFAQLPLSRTPTPVKLADIPPTLLDEVFADASAIATSQS